MPLSSTVAMLPDTPDSRLLAELSSYSDDLSEASDAIDQALQAGHDSPLWQPLTSYAVIAYMRAFAHSNVRSGLLAHVPIPDDLVDTHDMIRGYRNTTIAHSQSELSMSLPLATLTPEGSVNKVIPITIRHNLPQTTARRVAEAIDRMSDLVSEMIKPLAERMTVEYQDASPDAVAGWPVPDLDHEHADRFTAQSRRRRQPRFVAYWEVDALPRQEPR
ncbi:hypothetical protein GCM10023065_16240 [Microbacterium laevaniformans]|uniref:hypothetical protein n=1 Tax=Microbacterium laevaniformans TaxID=36807 RepID=UPI001959B74E|nr:hypothetical protein [Microbacterium laevaniformans]MBM7752574.1 hypothetical protein [Microbacterium laevaniformans]GLJ63357.1 hypothetical protein GCM10017578_02440 [Microbacterium laevaniformans]